MASVVIAVTGTRMTSAPSRLITQSPQRSQRRISACQWTV